MILVAGWAALLAYANLSYIAQEFRTYLALSLAGGIMMALTGCGAGLYDVAVLNTGFLRPWRALVTWKGAILALLGVVFFFQLGDSISRAWVGLWILFGAFGLGATRLVLRSRFLAWRAEGRMRKRVVVVGVGDAVERVASRLEQFDNREFYEVSGVFDDGSSATESGSRPALRPVDTVVPFVRANAVSTVLIAAESWDSPAVGQICADLADVAVEVQICTDYSKLSLPMIRTCMISNLALLQVSRPALSDWARIIKGLEDRILAGAMLLALAPLMLIAALAVRLDSRGPVFFRQQRFGYNNRTISVLKFRTMYADLGDITGAGRTVQNDRRVTRVGRILRMTSIDELPQLINVLRGEMSLVGPRAHPLSMKVSDQLYHEAVRGYAGRHRVKPGITGLAQINGCRGEVDTMEKALTRLRYDLEYVSRWSLMLDLKILLLTPIRGLSKAY